MNILNYLISGASRTIKSWKWILIIWSASLFLACLLILPAKSSFTGVLGSSMISEKLRDGIDIEVLFDPGTNMSTIFSSLTTGFFLVVTIGFLVNVFFNGGLFTRLLTPGDKSGSLQFFSSSARNFWSFFVMTIMIYLIIFFLALLIIVVPLIIVQGSDSEVTVYYTFFTSAIIFLVILPVILLVADYARAWQSASSVLSCFKAIAMGFRQTFRNFFSSYFIMVIIMIVQLLFSWFVFSLIAYMKPSTGVGLFLLFSLAQLLFIIKLFLRVCRYGSVTAMYEKHP
jgi:hypothetical protein